MIDLSFVDNKTKTIIGIISIILCIIVRFITPFYIESYMLLLLIPAIGLVIPHDSIKNSTLMAIITFIIIAFVVYTALNGFLNPTDMLSNIYFNGVLKTIPGVRDVFTCSTGNLVVMVYALLNIICGVLYFIPTTKIVDEY